MVGRAEPHNLALIHPEQDRVLTIRENARTQVDLHFLYSQDCMLLSRNLTQACTVKHITQMSSAGFVCSALPFLSCQCSQARAALLRHKEGGAEHIQLAHDIFMSHRSSVHVYDMC